MAKVKGRTTIRTGAVFFLVSGVLEIIDVGSATAIFGSIQFGIIAVVYHLFFGVLYFLCGIGLWIGKKWGYWSVMATTAAYSIDKIQLVLFPQVLYEYIVQQLTVTRDLVGSVPKENFIHFFSTAYKLMILCWWAFALYLYLRRHYFSDGKLRFAG